MSNYLDVSSFVYDLERTGRDTEPGTYDEESEDLPDMEMKAPALEGA